MRTRPTKSDQHRGEFHIGIAQRILELANSLFIGPRRKILRQKLVARAHFQVVEPQFLGHPGNLGNGKVRMHQRVQRDFHGVISYEKLIASIRLTHSRRRGGRRGRHSLAFGYQFYEEIYFGIIRSPIGYYRNDQYV